MSEHLASRHSGLSQGVERRADRRAGCASDTNIEDMSRTVLGRLLGRAAAAATQEIRVAKTPPQLTLLSSQLPSLARRYETAPNPRRWDARPHATRRAGHGDINADHAARETQRHRTATHALPAGFQVMTLA